MIFVRADFIGGCENTTHEQYVLHFLRKFLVAAENTLEPNTKEGERPGGQRDYDGHQYLPTLGTE
jgi:hypothetical protein